MCDCCNNTGRIKISANLPGGRKETFIKCTECENSFEISYKPITKETFKKFLETVEAN